MHDGETTAVQPLPVAALGEHHRRYRLADVAAEQTMARSLVRYGQLAPIVFCLRQDRPEVRIVSGSSVLRAVELLPRQAFQPWQELEAEQVTEREGHLALAVAIDVILFDRHLRAVT